MIGNMFLLYLSNGAKEYSMERINELFEEQEKVLNEQELKESRDDLIYTGIRNCKGDYVVSSLTQTIIISQIIGTLILIISYILIKKRDNKNSLTNGSN